MSESISPLVTVYIPTHNRLPLLKRAIESVVNQSFADLEVIVADDASTDETKTFVATLTDKDPRIRYLRSDMARGACHARNMAIVAAKGKYITGMDDDDEFLPHRIKDFLDNIDPDAAFLFAPVIWNFGQRRKVMKSPLNRIDLETLLSVNYVGNQVFVETEKLRSIGGFDVEMPACQDWDTWIRLSQKFGHGIGVERPSYLVHADHQMGRISTSHNKILGHQKLMKKFASISSHKNRLCQKLALIKAEGRPLSTRLLLQSITSGNVELFFRYWLASHFTGLYRLYQRKRT